MSKSQPTQFKELLRCCPDGDGVWFSFSVQGTPTVKLLDRAIEMLVETRNSLAEELREQLTPQEKG